MDETKETVKLIYTIHKYSSYSANYVPENIMVNSPTDQLSRWFTDSNTSAQYIMLKLTSPAIVESVTFGKYIKAHVSDLKKFQVLGGTDDKNMSILLSAGLKNDSSTEIFQLRHRTKEGLYLPVMYIKIVPLQSWGPAYNYTIWYLEIHGQNHPVLMDKVMDTINLRKEEEAVRILLKHLRRRRYTDAFAALARESGVRLEGAAPARLWQALVERGDCGQAEAILDEAVADGELNWFMSWQAHTPAWRQLSACSAAVEERLSCASPEPLRRAAEPAATARQGPAAPLEDRPECGEGATNNGADSEDSCSTSLPQSSCCDRPGPRGGHQLVVDPNTGNLFLFGGWSGTEDLNDLWTYIVAEDRWAPLCRNSGLVGGPSPRSCHKMVFDPIHRRLYTLGRYLDSSQRVPDNMKSDLYMFDVDTGTWALIMEDTATFGGPRLVFDHQMCIDPDTQTIYVFGGRILPADPFEYRPQYSGLYAYYIGTETWQLLLGEEDDVMKPRVGHSMLFHPIQRRLYVFAGQRNNSHLLELWWYDVTTRQCCALAAASSTPTPPPAAGFTQRATLDPHTDEMFVLEGMSKEKDKRVYNTLWVFSLKRLTWSCVYRNELVRAGEPRPRFAHQLVYDPNKKVHYLFGGNPGNQAMPRLRLDDLWALQLTRPGLDSVLAQARFAIRAAHYTELASHPATAEQAVHYLRNDVYAVLNHADPEQVDRFHALPTVIFAGPTRPAASGAPGELTPARARRLARRRARGGGPRGAELAQHLAAVLGGEYGLPSPTTPFEETAEPTPDTWDVGDDSDDDDTTTQREWRAARIALYDSLCKYFRPSTVPPQADISDLVRL